MKKILFMLFSVASFALGTNVFGALQPKDANVVYYDNSGSDFTLNLNIVADAFNKSYSRITGHSAKATFVKYKYLMPSANGHSVNNSNSYPVVKGQDIVFIFVAYETGLELCEQQKVLDPSRRPAQCSLNTSAVLNYFYEMVKKIQDSNPQATVVMIPVADNSDNKYLDLRLDSIITSTHFEYISGFHPESSFYKYFAGLCPFLLDIINSQN
ncbi:hypothetical protein P0136_12450 [Lentisphaerota bacterium ZTH]|nr:hypothetical protein JYG24_10035 [Lentisphaerota bacterium]WET06168.1 hypothetical protein P0136_12450 [Lentisphaerota bacterium ZTH]